MSARARERRRAAEREMQRVWLEKQTDPRYRELATEVFDGEAAARHGADEAAQSARLARAGFRHRLAAADGLGTWDHDRFGLRIVHSLARELDGEIWAHISVSRRDGALPGWYEARDAQWLLYPGEPGVIVVAPQSQHVNLAEVAHVWTCLTKAAVPDFTHGLATI